MAVAGLKQTQDNDVRTFLFSDTNVNSCRDDVLILNPNIQRFFPFQLQFSVYPQGLSLYTTPYTQLLGLSVFSTEWVSCFHSDFHSRSKEEGDA